MDLYLLIGWFVWFTESLLNISGRRKDAFHLVYLFSELNRWPSAMKMSWMNWERLMKFHQPLATFVSLCCVLSWRPPLLPNELETPWCVLCCGSRSSLCRGQTECGGGRFNGVLPTQACCWEALSVWLTRPAPAPRHIAQVIALIIVQPRQLFSESDTGARRFREERREDSSITVWARETIQSLATSSLELMSRVTATCKVINQNNKYCILTKGPTAPFVSDSAPASNKRTQRFQASLRSRYKRACVFCLYYCLNLLWKSLLQPPY